MSDVQLKNSKHVGVSFNLDGDDLVAVVTPESIGAVRVGSDAALLGSGEAPANRVLGSDGSGGTAWVTGGGGGAGSFTQLSDAPSSFAGAAGQFLVVKASEDGIEFVPSSGGGVSVAWGDVTGKPSTFTPASHSHSASDVTSGTLPVVRGGTGAASFTTGQFIRMGSGALEGRSTAQVLGDIGAAATSHTHSMSDITSGSLSVARGGTGVSTLTAGSFLRGDGTNSVSLRTPSQVLGDIGAAPLPTQVALGSTSGSKTIDLVGASEVEVTVTLTGNITLAFSNPPSPRGVVTIYARQNGTGGYKFTYPSGTVFLNGSDGSLNGAANSYSIVTIVTLDGGSSWMVTVTDARPNSFDPVVYNPQGNGDYYFPVYESMTLELGSVLKKGTGTLAFAKSTGGAFSAVSGSTAFAAGDELRVSVSGFSDRLSFAIPRSA